MKITRLALLFIGWFLVFAPLRADSVMELPEGGKNILVTFSELDALTTFPMTYRGVTYTLVEGAGIGIWIIQDMPITRFVKSPMLAMTTSDEPDGEPAAQISLRLDFEQPTQFFGFGLGFNDRTQTPDGSLLHKIGSVLLEFSNGQHQVFPLSATRMLCCTETRFDYSDADDDIVGNGLVKSAIITHNYNYEPFAPGSGYPGDYFAVKFMGIDDVTYSTAIVPVPIDVGIDIDPGKEPNVINIKSNGFIPVAVLTDGDFDALQVDADTVKFGPSQAMTARYRVKDVDSDGDEDLLLYFRVQETGIVCSDKHANLIGKLYAGTAFVGTDSMQTKNCR